MKKLKITRGEIRRTQRKGKKEEHRKFFVKITHKGGQTKKRAVR
jgi:hypothetical protein